MTGFKRIVDHAKGVKRQLQAVLETDYFAAALENDKVIMASLDLLVRSLEKNQARIAGLEEDIRQLRLRLKIAENGSLQQGNE